MLRDANAELARERDVSRTDREMHRHALNAVYASTSWLITRSLLRGLKRITRHPTALALNGARAAVQRLPIRMETKLKIKTFILRKQFFRDALALAQQRSEARASKSQRTSLCRLLPLPARTIASSRITRRRYWKIANEKLVRI